MPYGKTEKAACKEAMQQIEAQDYTAELKKDDMQRILKYGIACCRRKCRVVVEREVSDLE